MAKRTQAFRTGMTVLRGGNVPAYTLEYLTPGRRRKTGEFETIVLPYIEIGRIGKCNVQYGEDYPTVSRVHAAIERRGNDYVLIQMSATNPTLINGQTFSDEIALKNGDEIQLSMEGPRLRFNITESGTSNMGFTKKISLVTRQAIKPYRTMAYILLVIIVLIAGTGGWFLYKQNQQLISVNSELQESEQKRLQDSIRAAEEFSARSKEVASVMAKNKELSSVIKGQSDRIDKQSEQIESLVKNFNAPAAGNILYDEFKNAIYFLELLSLEVIMPDGSYQKIDKKWTGTAFLCNDGKLVTARSCIQNWRYSSDVNSQWINFAELNKGQVLASFRATSSENWFEFRYSDVILDDSLDETIVKTEVSGRGKRKKEVNIKFKYADESLSDWAYFQTSETSNIELDKGLSTGLPAGEDLYLLSFSTDQGSPVKGEIDPIYSTTTVVQDGLSGLGLISISDRAFESDITGAPVFIKKGNSFKCIGVVPGAKDDVLRGPFMVEGIIPIVNIN